MALKQDSIEHCGPWADEYCSDGITCPYVHDLRNVKKDKGVCAGASSYVRSSQLCESWETDGTCSDDDSCTFVHDENWIWKRDENEEEESEEVNEVESDRDLEAYNMINLYDD
jgi:hypothetical protein